MLAAGVATWRLWRERGGAPPAVVCGHSLGEFTALVCAGRWISPPPSELVRFRGRGMQEAVPAGTGAMAAILGLDDAAGGRGLPRGRPGRGRRSRSTSTPPARLSSPATRAAVERAIEGAKRPRRQARGGAAGQRPGAQQPDAPGRASACAERLAEVELRAPRIRYVSAVDARRTRAPMTCGASGAPALEPRALAETPFARSPQAAWHSVIECGPGKVLTGAQPPHRAARESAVPRARGCRQSLQAALAAVQA